MFSVLWICSCENGGCPKDRGVFFEYNISMLALTRSIDILINAPIQTVFDSIADLTRHPEWSG
jgi:hypothetical protein